LIVFPAGFDGGRLRPALEPAHIFLRWLSAKWRINKRAVIHKTICKSNEGKAFVKYWTRIRTIRIAAATETAFINTTITYFFCSALFKY